MKFIRDAILRWARARQPDFVIGGQESPYLRRHWLLPRNRFFNVYVHEFLRSDDDRALHCHPWVFNASWLIEGEYVEHTIREGGVHVATTRRAGDFKLRWGGAPHRVELLPQVAPEHPSHWICGHPACEQCSTPTYPIPAPCWTVFITGPRVREWGFHCPKGWVPWQEFTDARDAGSIGKGCGE